MPNDAPTTTAAAPAATPAATATPAAATPAAPAAAAPQATPATATPAAKPEGNILADAGKDPAAVSKEDQTKYLAEKGLKPEEIAALDDAARQAKYDELKAADEKPKEVAPGDIEVKLPEGASVDQESLDAFKGIIADAKLSPSERAQKLVDMHASLIAKSAQAQMDLWMKTQADWQKEVKADKELGGENFDKVRATIAKALGHFGGEHESKIREAFELTGAGNNPALVRVFYRMASQLVEAGMVSGSAPGASPSAAALLYPTAAK